MTTVAWDGKTIAADSQATGAFIRSCNKIFLIDHDIVFGGCGYREDNLAVLEYLEKESSGIKPEKPKISDTFAGILVICGKAFRIEQNLMRDPILEPYHAVGSGACYAIVAMYLGKSAKDAVDIAIKFDESSSGDVHTIQIPEYKKLK